MERRGGARCIGATDLKKSAANETREISRKVSRFRPDVKRVALLRSERASPKGCGKSLDVLSEMFDIPKMICAQRRNAAGGSATLNVRAGWCRKGVDGRKRGGERKGGRERSRKAERMESVSEKELEGSNRTSKLNVEIRVESLPR